MSQLLHTTYSAVTQNIGKAIVTFLKQENRKTFNVERGDVLMIPSGTTAYLTNIQNDEKLQIAELLRPVNIPGRYQVLV